MLRHSCSHVKFAKSLRTPILKNYSKRLLLRVHCCKVVWLIESMRIELKFPLEELKLCVMLKFYLPAFSKYDFKIKESPSKKNLFNYIADFRNKIIHIKGTIMQIAKPMLNDRLGKSILKITQSNYLQFCSNLPVTFAIFLESSVLFNSSYCLFCI